MGSDTSSTTGTCRRWCFDPRSRMGSDRRTTVRGPSWTWGFDPRSRMGSDDDGVPGMRAGHRLGGRFDPSLPHGERPSLRTSRQPRTIAVSIHAPAWGATTGAMALASMVQKFRSTLPQGERLGRDRMSASTSGFIAFRSTLPHGERRLGRRARGSAASRVSIHAPARGATSPFHDDIAAACIDVSIHAPAWGATRPCPPCAALAAVVP